MGLQQQIELRARRIIRCKVQAKYGTIQAGYGKAPRRKEVMMEVESGKGRRGRRGRRGKGTREEVKNWGTCVGITTKLFWMNF